MLHQLSQIYFDYIPIFALVNFLLFVFLIIYNYKFLKEFFLTISKKSWLILLGIFILGFLLRLFIIPIHHVLYMDEQWYMEAAKNMITIGSQGNYFKPIGWPFIIAIFFSIFGINNYVALYTSLVFGALTIFIIFFVAYIIFKEEKVGLLSALIFSILPSHIFWSTSAETNITSLFFILLTIFFYFLYYKKENYSLLWLSAITFSFTSLMRQENFILLPLFFIGLFIFQKTKILKLYFNPKFILPWAIAIILSLPNFVVLISYMSSINWIVSDTKGMLGGSNWSFGNLINNTIDFFPFFTVNNSVVLSFIFFIGTIYYIYRKDKKIWFLFSWFLLFWFAYFFSWMQTLAFKNRFFMSFSPILIIGSVYFIFQFIKEFNKKKNFFYLSILIFMIILSFIPVYNNLFINAQDKEKILETKIPELIKKELPSNSIIITNVPMIITSTTKFKSFSLGEFLDDRKNIYNKDYIYLFFEDIYCFSGYNTINYYSDYLPRLCSELKKQYNLEAFKTYYYKDINYTFYKILNKK